MKIAFIVLALSLVCGVIRLILIGRELDRMSIKNWRTNATKN
jgi:hypothetical protein